MGETISAVPTQTPSGSATGAPVVANSLSETGLREFYDPASRQAGEPRDAFIDSVAASRCQVRMGALGALNGYEVMLVEGVHALIDHAEGVPLPVAAERQQAIIATVEAYACSVAEAVIEVVDELVRDTTQLADMLRGNVSPLPSRVVLAGRVLAAVAHEGGMRRSGRDYYMHPDEVATIATTAWKRQIRGDDDRLDVVRFLAYGHDGFEDTIDPHGEYLTEKTVIVSPLVAQRVLELLEVPDARGIARILLLMARTKDPDGGKMDYFEYLDRGVREGGSLFVLTKAPDIHHNLNIEPEMIERGDRKARARYEKRDTYRAAADEIRTAAEAQDASTAWVVHSVFAVTADDIAPTTKSDTVSLQEIAATVRRKVVARTVASTS